MGFSTGEIIWFEPISQKYTRLNKNVSHTSSTILLMLMLNVFKGIINATPVSEIRWIPGSENLFLAAHMDGSLVVYDKEKDDAAFLPEENGVHTNGDSEKSNGSGEHSAKLHVDKSVHSKNQKFNPVSFWKLSNQRINAFAFSPDNRHLAVVSEDGTLRIIDYLKEQYENPEPFLVLMLTLIDFWIFMQVITGAFSVFAGHRTENTFSLAARMTSSPYGPLQSLPLSHAARVTNLGLLQSALTRGAAMTEIIALEVSVKIAGSYFGISV